MTDERPPAVGTTIPEGEAAVDGGRPVSPLALQVRRATCALVGRPGEIDAVQQELAAAMSGRLAGVTVEGEPGIGKTRLILAAQELAASEGFLPVAVTADEELRGPFLMARSMLACQAVREAVAGTAAEPALQKALDAVTGRETPGLAGLPPEAQLLRTFDLAAVALEEIAGLRPVALLLDDVQWADEDSLRMIRYLVRSGATSPIFLMLALRPEETARVSELVNLIADLERLGYVRRLRLGRFSQIETAQFLRLVLSGDIHATTAATMHAQSEGVPFVIEELAHAYREGGLIQQIDGVWTLVKNADRLLPSAVRTLIQRRAARLPDEAKALLADAAVIGRSFSLRDLGEVRQRVDSVAADHELMAEALQPAVEAGLMVQHPQGAAADFSFTHGQVRDFASGLLSVSRRRALHGALVDMLAGGDPPPESLALLAQHARAAGNAELATRYSIDGARAALETNAPEEVLRILDLGLPLAADPRDRVTMLSLRDDAFDALRRTEDRLEGLTELTALAEALGDDRLSLEIMLRRAAALRDAEDEASAAELARDVRRRAAQVGDAPLELKACLELGQALLKSPLGEGFVPLASEVDLEGSKEAYDRALGLAEELGDEPATAATHRELGVVLMAQVRAEYVRMMEAVFTGSIELPDNLFDYEPLAAPYLAAIQRFQTAIGMYERLGDQRGLMASIIGLAYAAYGPSHKVGAAHGLEEVRRLASRMKSLATGSERAVAEVQMLYGIHLYAREFGYPDLALPRGEEAWRAARRIGERSLEFLAASGMALTHLQFGEPAPAHEWLDRAAAAAAASPTPLRARQLELWRGRLAATEGDAPSMRAHLERAVSLATEQGRAAGRCEAVARLSLEAARLGAERGDAEILAVAERAAGQAQELCRSLPGHPPWAAQAGAALAHVALARGDQEVAVEHARKVLEEIYSGDQDELFLDMLLPASRALLAHGTDADREATLGHLRMTLGAVAENTMDEDVRNRWFGAPVQRELLELAGGMEAAVEAIRSSPFGVIAATFDSLPRPPIDEEDVPLLRLVVEDRPNQEIAATLSMPEEEVARRMNEMFAKMGASSRASAAALALMSRLV